jgi:hypothetical protein
MSKAKKPKRKLAHLHPWAYLDRPAAAHRVRVKLGVASELLDLDVDFGLRVLQDAHAIRSEIRPSLTSSVALLAFHRALELLDGVSVLIRAGGIVPAVPLVRCYFEAVLHARYLMTVNDERVAAAYIVSQPLAIVTETMERAAPHAPGSGPTIVARDARESFEEMLVEDRLLREARGELRRLSDGSSAPVPWYQAFGGPRTIGGLSGRVEDAMLSRLFDEWYSRWSAAVHVADTVRDMDSEALVSDSLETLYRPMRDGMKSELVSTVTTCHSLFTEMLVHQMTYYNGALGDVKWWTRREAPLRACLLEEEREAGTPER